MAASRQRPIVTYCKSCKAEQEIRPVREGFEGKVLWFKCTGCAKMVFMKKEDYENILQNDDKGVHIVDKEQEPVPYDPTKKFSVGQVVYHKVWNDQGHVVKKETTNSGHQAIIVAFHRLGERTLVENLSS